jgi:hypothetical protein
MVDLEADPMRRAPTLDQRLALGAVERERHGDDDLQGVALRAPGRRDVGLAARGPYREIQDAGDRLGRDARAVVGNDDLPIADLDANHRRCAAFLGSIKGVVGQFLENDERPLVDAVPDLFDQLALGAEVEQARRLERLALQDVSNAGDGP